MKLNKFIFKHFAPIPSKQWKQKIQYELQGANYQTELVHTNSDGISSLPYYTQSENEQVIDTEASTINTYKAAHISVSVKLDKVLSSFIHTLSKSSTASQFQLSDIYMPSIS